MRKTKRPAAGRSHELVYFSSQSHIVGSNQMECKGGGLLSVFWIFLAHNVRTYAFSTVGHHGIHIGSAVLAMDRLF
jgi:hypothetical protein